MRHLIAGLLAGLVALSLPAQASADAGNFALVNASGANITALAIRRTGSSAWKSLGATPSNGARVAIQFSDPDCAFDLRASLAAGGEAVWTGVNLCEVKSVTLRRGASGATFVDYD